MKQPADGWDHEERAAVDELQDELEKLQARHQRDPAVDLLRAARHDALPSELLSRAEHRLENDEWNRALVDGLDRAEPSLDRDDQDRLLVRIQREARRGAKADAKRLTWLRPLVTSAAAAALAVAGWIVMRDLSQAPQVAPLRPEQPVAITAQAPVFQLPLEKPEVTLSLSALTWRGSGGANQLLADLKAPLDAFREGDYARADREFAALEPRYPRAIEVFFYGGVARLFVNDPERASVTLARAGDLADPAFASRVSWYRAIAEQRAGRAAEARRHLDALCRGQSDRSADSCRAIEQLDPTSRPPDAR